MFAQNATRASGGYFTKTMVAIFTENEKKKAFAEKKKLLLIWAAFLAAYLASIATLIIVNCVDIALTASRDLQVPFTVLCCVLTVAFGGGSHFFFSIKYRLTRNYCRMLSDMKSGLKDRGKGKFVAVEHDIGEKSGVEFYSLVLDCPPMKRGDITERKILVEKSHILPTFDVGDEIEFVTYANILVAFDANKVQTKTEEKL